MLLSHDVRLEIDRVFMDPMDWPPDDRRPLLYLLRRDLKDQYGREEEPAESVQLKSPLLTCLGIMVGFELLAKLWSGKHEFRERDGKATVKEFMRSIVRVGEHEADALVDFRNSLAHSYGLSIGKGRSLSVDDDTGSACREVSIADLGEGKSKIYVNVWHLKDLFVRAVRQYRLQLGADCDLQKKFTVCLANLGEIHITGSVKSR